MEGTQEVKSKGSNRQQKFLDVLEETYRKERAQDAEILHNALAEVIAEQKASIEATLFVLDIIRFELMEAKYREIMGTVQLSDKPPIPIMGKK